MWPPYPKPGAHLEQYDLDLCWRTTASMPPANHQSIVELVGRSGDGHYDTAYVITSRRESAGDLPGCIDRVAT
jgi:hypothetical protein